jgi:spermidine/putrescine transport system substrate-binding protein
MEEDPQIMETEAAVRLLIEQKMQTPINRRQFLQRAGSGVVMSTFGASLLAACGGGGGDGGNASSGGGGGEIGGTLRMVIWDGYDDKKAFKPFLDKHGVKTQPTYIGNNEEIFTKLRAGGVGSVDLVTPYHGYIGVLHDADLLEPLDYSKLPNSKGYLENFNKPDWNTFDGQTYSAPFIWGTDPMMYNEKFVKEPPQSWKDVLKPEYKGKVVMVDDTLGQIMVWGKVLGYDPPVELTPEQLDDVINYLIEIKKKHARTFASSWGDMADIMARGDAWISTGGWEAIKNFAADKGGQVNYTHPQEGDFAWTDSWCIPKDAPNQDTAYAWIDWILGGVAQAQIDKDLSGGAVTQAAIDKLDPETKAIFPYDNLDPVFAKAPNYAMPPRDPGDLTTLDDWNKAWERLRAA